MNTASLAITSSVAGIEGWLGDRKLGDTRRGQPLIAGDLAPDTYQLRAKKAGHRDWTLAVAVAPNERRQVDIDIQPLSPARVVKGEDGVEKVLVPSSAFWMGRSGAASSWVPPPPPARRPTAWRSSSRRVGADEQGTTPLAVKAGCCVQRRRSPAGARRASSGPVYCEVGPRL
ncbi:MAG TPA: hypothetical protein VMT79_08025 [Candidatus Binatia bacterium]|nr:hypothetical protein [Candidatus Binatia bacterium]